MELTHINSLSAHYPPLNETREAELLQQWCEGEQEILRLRFWAEPTLNYTEIGAKVKLSRERVRQLEQIARRKLRRTLDNDTPQHFAA